MPHAADMELWMRLAANADVGFIRGVDQAYYRQHQENMRKGYGVLRDLRERRLVYETVLDRWAERLPDATALSGMVHRKLGREALWGAGCAYDRGRMRQTELARRLLGAGTTGEEREVGELVAFALDCWPEVSRLPLYRTLESHKAIGPRALGCMFAEKVQWWLRRRSWRYRGI
jgi:hypothetical protein